MVCDTLGDGEAQNDVVGLLNPWKLVFMCPAKKTFMNDSYKVLKKALKNKKTDFMIYEHDEIYHRVVRKAHFLYNIHSTYFLMEKSRQYFHCRKYMA